MQKCYDDLIASARKGGIYLLTALLVQVALVNLAYAQTRTVNGRVTSLDGSLPGVNVLEKGTNNAAITNSSGQYSIKVAEDAVLVFSYVGFLSESISVVGKSTLDVELKDDIKALGEVVVVGYGAQEKKTVTG